MKEVERQSDVVWRTLEESSVVDSALPVLFLT